VNPALLVGRRVYVSGYFGRINGVRRDGLAALDPRTGAVGSGWEPAHGGTDVVHLALTDSRLYLGGMSGFSALDAGTDAFLRLPPNHARGEVLALAVSGRLLFVAGRT
jgi:hypothetical protein